MSEPADIPYAQRQRLQFIESMVLWEGAVQRQRVSEVFDVSPNNVTRDIARYVREYPNHLAYDLSAKAYRAGAKFKPVIASGSPEEYLTALQAHTHAPSSDLLPILGSGKVSAAVLPHPPAVVDRSALAAVIQTAQRGIGLKVSYLSLTATEPSFRTIWPHSLVHTGERWHARAFDDKRMAFRDFVLQRLEVQGIEEATSPKPVQADRGWCEFEVIRMAPNRRLTEAQKKVVAREYGMQKEGRNWVWSVSLRKCLIGYFVQRHRLDLAATAKPETRIMLLDRSRLERYFFGHGSGHVA